MKIELLYVPNCPNHAVVLARLREILSAETFHESVSEVLVTDIAMAQSLKFRGSPTIRINGNDVEPQNEKPAAFGLMCRLYPDGSGGPSPKKLKAAIEEAHRRDPYVGSSKITAASLGAVLASLLTLACCLPLPLLGAAGIAGAAVFLAGARPWLLGLSIILLALGSFQVYRGMRCRERQGKLAIVLLALATVIVILLVLFPQMFAGLLADMSQGGWR